MLSTPNYLPITVILLHRSHFSALTSRFCHKHVAVPWPRSPERGRLIMCQRLPFGVPQLAARAAHYCQRRRYLLTPSSRFVTGGERRVTALEASLFPAPDSEYSREMSRKCHPQPVSLQSN